MRKFLICTLVLLFALAGCWYAVYFRGFYLRPGDAPVSVPVKAQGRQLLVQNGAGEYEPFTVKGVAVSSSLPGQALSEYAAAEETYRRWLTQIAEMGANTVWVTTIMDDDFYNALFSHNAEADAPLYLLQGISVSDDANRSSKDAYDGEFFGGLMRDAADAVDVVHGRKNITLNRLRGSGIYRRDVSPWVLGYVVGHEWDPGVIAYTNHRGLYTTEFEGEYLSTARGALPFEALIAQVLERLAAYETEKYGVQHPVSFINDPQNDPFHYDQEYGRQIAKYNSMDAGHIAPTDRFAAGVFASYRLYEFCSGYASYFSDWQKRQLGDTLTGLDKSRYYEGYAQLLSEYHTMPVLITGYGFSTSRGLVSESQAADGPLSERGQGERLVSAWRDFVDSGCAGGVISAWQDTWGQRTWNTAYAVDLADAVRWHDLQTDGQGYGLLAFDPGREERVCNVDGDASEWSGERPVLDEDGVRLYARSDEEGLYLLVRGEDVAEDVPLYLPIDVTPASGSESCGSPALRFSRAADFLLCLQGPGGSRLLVQERYDSARQNFSAEIEAKDSFVDVPDADSPVFGPVRMVLLPTRQVRRAAVTEDRRREGTHVTWETGRLVHGSDFCYGDGCVEVRLPWALLNFSDPSEGQVHDDYYRHYGVENRAVSHIWLGASRGEGTIPLGKWELRPWNAAQYHERLKESYQILRREWR